MYVKDIMTLQVTSCDSDATLQAVAQMMEEQDFGCIPVVEEQQDKRAIVGLVTDRDIVCRGVAAGIDMKTSTVAMVMSDHVETIGEKATIETCIQRLSDKKIRRLVVVDKSGSLCGIITQGDIARAAPTQKTGALVKRISQSSAKENQSLSVADAIAQLTTKPRELGKGKEMKARAVKAAGKNKDKKVKPHTKMTSKINHKRGYVHKV
jgi:CBS domain-containing protein